MLKGFWMEDKKKYKETQEIILEGHLLDSLVLSRVIDTILDLDGDLVFEELSVGKKKHETTFAKILLKGKNRKHIDLILDKVHNLGARIPFIEDAVLAPAPKDGILPDNFYSTTNHPTYVYYNKRWIQLPYPEMDKVIVVDPIKLAAECRSMDEIRKGDLVVVGNSGVRLEPSHVARDDKSEFNFMLNKISTERSTKAMAKAIAKDMANLKKNKGKIAIVAGPSVVHTGAAPALADIIKAGYVDLLLAGNGLAAHDIEYALLGTSLGLPLKSGVKKGEARNYIYAINEVRKAGSIRNMVKSGALSSGIMYECIENDVKFLLSGSIRDDGPLPEVMTDVMEAQRVTRKALRGFDMVIMLSTVLHSVSVGNTLPSYVRVICVDINSDTVTRLIDRGVSQAFGLVTDVGSFLYLLEGALSKIK